MLTPQEVSSVVFEKAVFGGYEISAVDKFLNRLTEDYSTLCRDNEHLRKLLLTMEDKLVESRANEDAMRLALLSANKTAKELAEKAKAEQTVQPVDMSAQVDALTAELEKEKAALQRAKEAAASYLVRLRETISDCEAALTDLYGESAPEDAAQETVAEV